MSESRGVRTHTDPRRRTAVSGVFIQLHWVALPPVFRQYLVSGMWIAFSYNVHFPQQGLFSGGVRFPVNVSGGAVKPIGLDSSYELGQNRFPNPKGDNHGTAPPALLRRHCRRTELH
jgi:hypothetical protein